MAPSKGHPKTCGCGSCRGRLPEGKRGGRHPKLCQCAGCTRKREMDWSRQLFDRMAQSREAMQHKHPTAEKPVFVRAYWRKQKGWMSSDPGLHDLLLGEE